ncbi:19563_t:CDS:1, partial [Racocetra persica]
PDFMSQKNHLQEVIKAAGHICIFYPKFHYELNYIEAFWEDVKRYIHLHCGYSFKSLKETIPQVLNSVTLAKIRWFACRSEQFMSAYARGLS